jgi:hypothetical protein
MNTMKSLHSMPSRQRGAALVIGLVLLMILTLLAITGMNTASTELIMAGNEQYRQNAFQAAEVGVERAIAALPTVPQDGVTRVVPDTPVQGSPNDFYSTGTTYIDRGSLVEGSSGDKFETYHYEIVSAGSSRVRNSRSVHRQGAYFIQKMTAPPSP